jgi:DeoR family fructose operon transcriptional repressor
MCKHIKNKKGLTVITNNLRVCEELGDSSVKVIGTGGGLISKRACFAGPFSEELIKKIRADMLFFSSQGISSEGVITDSSEAEVSVRRAMLSVAKKSVFLADSSKVGKEYPFVLASLSDLTESIIETAENKNEA